MILAFFMTLLTICLSMNVTCRFRIIPTSKSYDILLREFGIYSHEDIDNQILVIIVGFDAIFHFFFMIQYDYLCLHLPDALLMAC